MEQDQKVADNHLCEPAFLEKNLIKQHVGGNASSHSWLPWGVTFPQMFLITSPTSSCSIQRGSGLLN